MSGRRDQQNTDSRGRTEPTLGSLDHLDEVPVDAPADDGLPPLTVEPRSPREPRRGGSVRSTPPSRRGWLIPLLLLLVIALGTTAWINQNRLRSMLPRTELNDVLTRAQQALQAGHLDGQDGTSARELFQTAVVLQPDNDAARTGLRQVGQAELAQADVALQGGHVEQATQLAATARSLLGGGADVDRLDQAIAAAGASKVETSALVEQAQAALAAGQLDGPQGAAALYQRMLQANSGSAVARHGLDQVGDALAAQAQAALTANDRASADAHIKQLESLQPNNGALPALRAAQAQATQRDNSAVDDALKQGLDALRAGRVAGAGPDTALAHFKAAQALDPSNAQARDGLGKVARALIMQAGAALDAGDTTQASQLLDQATPLAPKSADLAAARAHVASEKAKVRIATPADAAAVPDQSEPAPLSPQQSAQVAQLLRRAQQATKHGDIMTPPGDCAYDLYRSALAIDGNNTAAMQGLQALPGRVRGLFDHALSSGNLGQAGDMLANFVALAPGDAAQNSLSNRLAMAWLDQAQQQIGRGDRVGATQSLDQARKLAPNHPRLLELSARLEGSR
ncbi:MAG: hypothetical protein ABI114_00180 [Rhodanobacter sp.]